MLLLWASGLLYMAVWFFVPPWVLFGYRWCDLPQEQLFSSDTAPTYDPLKFDECLVVSSSFFEFVLFAKFDWSPNDFRLHVRGTFCPRPLVLWRIWDARMKALWLLGFGSLGG